MYKLMMYFLLVLLGAAAILSAVKILPYNPIAIVGQTVFLVFFCWYINQFLAKLFKTTPNPESPVITALILAAIMGPISLVTSNIVILALAALAAMASKYLIATKQSHIFNPAAFGAVVVGLLGFPSSWWIGSPALLPIILIGGILVVQKIRRWPLVITFLAVYSGFHLILRDPVLVRLNPALFFLTFVMLIEPLTSPAGKKERLIYGGVVAASLVALHNLAPNLTFPLELALLVGNVYARVVTKDFRQTLKLVRRHDLTPSITEFWFQPIRPANFIPGQFLEYTLPHPKPDSRGIRRWFTIAASPTEGQILITTKFSEKSSSFKQALRKMKIGDEITASKVEGDFVLPANQADSANKLIFVAGGIGITPYRSMIKYLLDKNEKRDIVLLYGAKTEQDFVFKDIFAEAEAKGWLKPIYVTTPLSAELVKEKVPDWHECTIYVSGPEPMVESLEKQLLAISVPDARLKRDYFPGYEGF